MSPLMSMALVLALALGGATTLWSASSLQTEKSESPTLFTPNLLLVLNDDRLVGNLTQFRIDPQQKWGEFIDDDLLYIEGRYDKYEGSLWKRSGYRNEKIERRMDERFEKNNIQQYRKGTP